MLGPRSLHVVNQIKQRHGAVIDLDRSPHTIIDILQNFGHLLGDIRQETGGGHGAPGSPGPTAPPPPPPEPPGDEGGGEGAPGSPKTLIRDIGMDTVVNLLLEMKREVGAISAKIESRS